MASELPQTIADPARGALLDLYAQMALIRAFETEAERQYKLARIGGYCHLSIGQEATCVGAVAAMETTTCWSPAIAATASPSPAGSRPRP